MERRGHIFRLVACTAAFVGQVLCGSGISYSCPDGLGDSFTDTGAVNDNVGMQQNTPPYLPLSNCLTGNSNNVRLEGEAKASSFNPLAFKINLLYSLFLIPEVSVEYGFGDGWSVSGGWMYGWWKRDGNHHYWRAYGGYASLRRYLGPQKADRPLTGHHVGVYAQLLTYDVEFGDKGYIAGRPGGSLWDKANYGFGIEYGFSLPASKSVNFDFSLGVGYLGGTYYEYTPMNGHYVWDSTKSRHWFGPTKAEVSVVWLFDTSFFGLRKGGRR